MSTKFKELRKNTIRLALMAFAVVAAVGGAYAGAMMYGDSVEQKRNEAEGKFNSDNSLQTNLQNQIDKTGASEKSFVTIQAWHSSPSYYAEMTDMVAWLKNAGNHYHFSAAKLSPPSDEAVSDKPELTSIDNYKVLVRSGMKLDFDALSDTHVFSFLDDFVSNSPGFVRIDKVTLIRKSDIDDKILSQIRSGVMPLLVNASVEFTWIVVTKKEKPTPNNPQAGKK